MSDWSSIPRGDRFGRPGTWWTRQVVEVMCPHCSQAIVVQVTGIDTTGNVVYPIRCTGGRCGWTGRVALEDFAGEVVT